MRIIIIVESFKNEYGFHDCLSISFVFLMTSTPELAGTKPNDHVLQHDCQAACHITTILK